MSNTKTTLFWFRKGLRLHDNKALVDSVQRSNKFIPFYILSDDAIRLTSDLQSPVQSSNRLSFLLQTLHDLNKSLQQLGSQLYVFEGDSVDVISNLIDTLPDCELVYDVALEPKWTIIDEHVSKLLPKDKIKKHNAHTVFDYTTMGHIFDGKHPSYQAFVQTVTDSLAYKVRPAVPAPTKADFAHLDKIENNIFKNISFYCGDFATNESLAFPGGETEALERLQRSMANKSWVKHFEKPKTSPNSLEPSTTVLSPYLANGCLSARMWYLQLKDVYKGDCSKPPVSLLGQLLWREFFTAAAYWTDDFHLNKNDKCRNIKWDANDEFLRAWATAQTGYPFIDAVMTQLTQQGWIHHLARHSVACFLTRGHLFQSWEAGEGVFEALLLDADYGLNAGNWQWLSASAFFHQYFRVYSPVAFGKKTDPNGLYIKRFLPALAKMPKKFIYEPWKAPIEVQRSAGCIIGTDYPAPIVDIDEAKSQNLKRMNDAYDEYKQRQIKKQKVSI